MMCQRPLSRIVSSTFFFSGPSCPNLVWSQMQPLSLLFPQQNQIGGHRVGGSQTRVYPSI